MVAKSYNHSIHVRIQSYKCMRDVYKATPSAEHRRSALTPSLQCRHEHRRPSSKMRTEMYNAHRMRHEKGVAAPKCSDKSWFVNRPGQFPLAASLTLFLYCALRAHVRCTNLINTLLRYICGHFSVRKMYGLRGSEGVKTCLGVINVTDRER